MTVEEAAVHLGVKPSWLYAHQEVPRYKFGRLLRFCPDELDEWVKQQGGPRHARGGYERGL